MKIPNSNQNSKFLEISHSRENEQIKSFTFHLKREGLKKAYRQDGIYLLRTNLSEDDPARLWEQCIQLTEIEAAFRTLKSEAGLRPIYHWVAPRVEAHVMVAFMAYAMWVCLKWKLKALAPSLSPRQMIDMCWRLTGEFSEFSNDLESPFPYLRNSC
jgi:transposase